MKQSDPLEQWTGSFGAEYIERNALDEPTRQEAAAVFSRVIDASAVRGEIKSVLEVGANIGINLAALRGVLSDARLSALEPNPAACRELRSDPELALDEVLVETAYLAWHAGVPAVRLSRPMLRRLLAFGFPTTLVVFADTLLSSIDRTVILEKLDAEQLGYCSMAFIGVTFIAGVATVPTAVLYPRLSECYGRTGRPSDLTAWVPEPLRLAGIGFAVLIGAMVLALPALVHAFLPKYVPGVLAAQVAIFGHYAFSVVGVACNAFLALNRMKLYLAITLVASGATYLFARGMVHLAPGLTAVAVGCSCGMFIFLVLGVLGAYCAMERPFAEGLRACGIALAPIVYVGAALAAIEWALRRWTHLHESSIGRGVFAELLFAVAVLPWLATAAGRLKR